MPSEGKKLHEIKEAASYAGVLGASETKRSRRYKKSILSPPIYDSNYLARKTRGRVIFKVANEVLADGMKTGMDIGCGTSPYDSFFSKFAENFFGIDIATTPYIDVRGDIETLPVKSASIDFIVCNMSIEHVRDVKSVISEAWRALKPGGTLLIDMPQIVELHGEEDFWRFTRNGAKLLLQDFKIERIVPCGGFFITWGHMLNQFIDRMLARKYLKFIGFIFYPITNIIFSLLDRGMAGIFSPSERGRRILDSYYYPFTINNFVAAKKE